MPQRGCRMRLNKYLAQCGVCSRRDADKLIEQGKVLVNGQIAGMGQQVEETDTVQVGKKILQAGRHGRAGKPRGGVKRETKKPRLFQPGHMDTGTNGD